MRLIDADALIDEAMDRYCKDCDKRKGIKNGKWRIIYEIGEVPCRACDVDDMIDDLENAPTVDAVVRKRGRWIDEAFKPNGLVFHPYKCDQCGEHNDASSDYCPNCGADMRKAEEE